MSTETRVNLSWIASVQLGSRPKSTALARYFSGTPRTSLFRSHSIPTHLWTVPVGLAPRDGFHELASKAALGRTCRRTPYPIFDISADARLEVSSLSADLFPGDVLTVTIRAKAHLSPEQGTKALLKTLQRLRLPKQIPVIDALIREAIVLVQGDRAAARSGVRYRDYFLIDVELPLTPESIDQIVQSSGAELVALLIGAPSVELLKEDLVTYVAEASSELNEKAAGENLMINRQGVVYIHSAGKYLGPHPNRFSRTRDLARLALYARDFLRDDGLFSVRHRSLAQFIAGRLEQWVKYSELVFDASVSETRTWESFVGHFQLPQRMAAWRDLFLANSAPGSLEVEMLNPAWWTTEQLGALMAADSDKLDKGK